MSQLFEDGITQLQQSIVDSKDEDIKAVDFDTIYDNAESKYKGNEFKQYNYIVSAICHEIDNDTEFSSEYHPAYNNKLTNEYSLVLLSSEQIMQLIDMSAVTASAKTKKTPTETKQKTKVETKSKTKPSKDSTKTESLTKTKPKTTARKVLPTKKPKSTSSTKSTQTHKALDTSVLKDSQKQAEEIQNKLYALDEKDPHHIMNVLAIGDPQHLHYLYPQYTYSAYLRKMISLDDDGFFRLDMDKEPWLQFKDDPTVYTIYYSYPAVPRVQCDITVTTDLNAVLDSELNKLYPNLIIRMRHKKLYEDTMNLGLDIDPILGWIPKISGFTREEVMHNIIAYPQISVMQKDIDENAFDYAPFYTTIEIDGELQPINIDTVKSIPDLEGIPFDPVYIQDYVNRRYLLERDVKHIEHKYPDVGNLTEYCCINMPYTWYSKLHSDLKLGKADPLPSSKISLMNLGMKNRIQYLRDANPIIARYENWKQRYKNAGMPITNTL